MTRLRLPQLSVSLMPANIWSSASSDLNPFDVSVRGDIERKTKATPHSIVDTVMAAMMENCRAMSADAVIKRCQPVWNRVEAVIAATDAHVEPKLTMKRNC